MPQASILASKSAFGTSTFSLDYPKVASARLYEV